MWGTGNQVSAFSDFCYVEVHEAGEVMGVSSGSYWQNCVKVGEGSGVGQEGYCLCGVGSTRRMGEKGGTTKDADGVVRTGRQKMREQRMKWVT